MKERILFLYIILLAGAALSFVFSGGALLERGSMVQIIIAALAALILISVALLLSLLNKIGAGRITAICAFAITAWIAGPALLPSAAATILFCLGIKYRRLGTVLIISALFCLVWVCISWPGIVVIIAAAMLLGFSLYALRLMEKIKTAEQSSEDAANREEEIRELLVSQRRRVRSTEQVSRLEERNRLAARIHDEIGHGMSGSILLLEGADLVMDKEPEKARDTIRKVTENLRESVEEIRKVLREERSANADVNLARIENELTVFGADHPNIKTKLDTSGDMGDVNSEAWTCIYENLVEALTNVLKHSSATLFLVSLKNSGGLLRVEFADNGGSRKDRGVEFADNGGSRKDSEIKFGIGLQSMEERAAICYGRCFFRHEEDGFHIVMTFPRRGKNG